MSAEWAATLFRIFLDSSLRVFLVGAAVALILLTLQVRSGGVRHAAWTAVLSAMLFMPLLQYFASFMAIPVPVPFRSVDWVPVNWNTPHPAIRGVLPGAPAPPVTTAVLRRPWRRFLKHHPDMSRSGRSSLSPFI